MYDTPTEPKSLNAVSKNKLKFQVFSFFKYVTWRLCERHTRG